MQGLVDSDLGKCVEMEKNTFLRTVVLVSWQRVGKVKSTDHDHLTKY